MNHNVAEVAALLPDYLGFIFFEGSKRNFSGDIPKINPDIKRVGVFVNTPSEFISEMIEAHKLDVVQLHGDETVDFCSQFEDVELWKVFSVDEDFDFDQINAYEDVVDAFLFDTHGNTRGGTGVAFNWDILAQYPSNKPLVLSGGIGPEMLEAVKEVIDLKIPIMAIDINSRFEVKPGLKNIELLKEFLDEL